MRSLHLFEGFGLELEYMVVDRESLAVLPVVDQLLAAVAGQIVDEVEVGPLRWSNELVLHVVELKTNGPAPSLRGLARTFVDHAGRINALLGPLGGRLMPSGMHPWMDPARETRLWPHEANPIYEAFDRIFGCRGHGWANLQSAHLNLPFHGDAEFGRLHAAVRLLLPLLPALAASSPIIEGRLTGLLDTRLDVYRRNQARIASITGLVVPEPVFTRADYERVILARCYRDIAPHDPDGLLQDEWLNSRGAIARFERDTIEIRVLDVQESPPADLAVTALALAAIRALVAERWTSLQAQQAWSEAPLATLLERTIAQGEAAVLDDPRYLATFGLPRRRATAGEMWRHLAGALSLDALDPEVQAALDVILEHGPLARRILRALGAAPSRSRLAAVYRRLCECLTAGRSFLP